MTDTASSRCCGETLTIVVLLLLMGTSSSSPAFAQEEPTSVEYKNFVRYSDGATARETSDNASFTAYLNGNADTVLIENAPQWDAGGNPNIAGDGTFGMELANFPHLAVGDTVHVRYTSLVRDQQGTLSEAIPSIPWSRFPQTLTLEEYDFPHRPSQLELTINGDERILSWQADAGLTFSIYRRTVEDTIHTGDSRNLYARIARDVTETTYTDVVPDPELHYGYIVYAHAMDGNVSAHSREAVEMDNVAGLQVDGGATNATLNWQPFEPPVGSIAGYNIYRREGDGDFGNPIAYTGPETSYTDTRLEPGATYEYQVRVRVDAHTETGASETVTVTLEDDPAGYATYASLETAVVIYLDTNLGQIDEAEIAQFERMLEIAREFYWRNSGLKLNLEFTYFVIRDRKEFPSREDYALAHTASDLADLGVMNTQYDLVFRITPATNGYWSFGITNLSLPGPERLTGFSQTQFPYGTGVEFPGHEDGLDYGLTWIFVHEAQHAIDAMYNENGHPQMAHGDIPWEFGVPKGEHFDFQAKIFREFTAYEDLSPLWGDIYEAPDEDGDGFVDNDPRVPFDEVTFGSSSSSSDTDEDGLTDREEAMAGIYSGSDPQDPDTDADGLLDGNDAHPRYPVSTVVPRFTPTIDGEIEDAWPVANDTVSYTQVGFAPAMHLAYDADSLYLALKLPHIGIPEIWFDFGSDGLWHGRGNTMMRINLTEGTFSELRTRDGSQEAREASESGAGMWDDSAEYANHFGGRIFAASRINLEVNLEWPRVQIEMAIPKNENAGLSLQGGDRFGIYVNYDKVNNQPDQWATTYDLYSFVEFSLAETVSSTDDTMDIPLNSAPRIEEIYPNPAQEGAHLTYTLNAPRDVEVHIYDVLGRRVKTIDAGMQAAGRHTITWDGSSDAGGRVAGGLFIIRLVTGSDVSDATQLVRL